MAPSNPCNLNVKERVELKIPMIKKKTYKEIQTLGLEDRDSQVSEISNLKGEITKTKALIEEAQDRVDDIQTSFTRGSDEYSANDLVHAEAELTKASAPLALLERKLSHLEKTSAGGLEPVKGVAKLLAEAYGYQLPVYIWASSSRPAIKDFPTGDAPAALLYRGKQVTKSSPARVVILYRRTPRLSPIKMTLLAGAAKRYGIRIGDSLNTADAEVAFWDRHEGSWGDEPIVDEITWLAHGQGFPAVYDDLPASIDESDIGEWAWRFLAGQCSEVGITFAVQAGKPAGRAEHVARDAAGIHFKAKARMTGSDASTDARKKIGQHLSTLGRELPIHVPGIGYAVNLRGNVVPEDRLDDYPLLSLSGTIVADPFTATESQQAA